MRCFSSSFEITSILNSRGSSDSPMAQAPAAICGPNRIFMFASPHPDPLPAGAGRGNVCRLGYYVAHQPPVQQADDMTEPLPTSVTTAVDPKEKENVTLAHVIYGLYAASL